MSKKSILISAILFCTVSVAAQIKLPKIPQPPKPPKVSKGLNTESPMITVSPYNTITTITGIGVEAHSTKSHGSDDGDGRKASFYKPWDIVVDDKGVFFISDFLNYRIRKMTADATVSTFAGSSQGQADGSLAEGKLYSPASICFDKNGDMIVADVNYNAIRKITKSGITTIAGGNGAGYEDGDVKTAKFNRPGSVAINSKGDIFVCDEGNKRIRKINGNMVTTYAGSWGDEYADGPVPAAEAVFLFPKNIAIDAGDIVYVTENTTVRKITPDGIVTTLAGKNGVQGRRDGKGAKASFSDLSDITISQSGNLFVIDRGTTDNLNDDFKDGTDINRTYREGGAAIRIVSPDGTVQTVAGSYICTKYPESVVNEGMRNRFMLTDGRINEAFLSYDVFGICVDKDENIYVTDAGFNCIRKISK